MTNTTVHDHNEKERMSVDSKANVEEIEIQSPDVDRGNSGLTEEEEEFIANFDKKKKARMYRKVDFRLLPVLGLLYLFAYIDRANIGNAKIEGLATDLHLTNTQYNACVSIFFVTYILFEIPANTVLHRYFRNRPSWWIGMLCVLWGLCMTLHGVVQNYGGLMVVRLAMGIPEAGFFPGAVLITSMWYPRHMLNIRISLFYTASALAGAFSGLLAFGIAKLNGVNGIRGWRWIFLLEGAFTVALGLAVPFLLPDQAATARWLNEEERRYMVLTNSIQDKSTQGSNHEADDPHSFKWSTLKSVLLDYKLWLLGVVYWSNTVPNYALKFSLPSIMKSMGYGTSQAQLMSIPPYVVGAIGACLAGWLSDKMRSRYKFILASQICVLTGFAILIPLAPKVKSYIGPCYFAICWVCLGVYPIGPGVNAWTANNLAGPAKRAMGVAFVISLCNIGGIIGSYIYLDKEAPRYPTGYGGSFAFAGLGVVAATVLEFCLKRTNKKREAMTPDEIHAKYTPQELADLGDKSPLFRYML